MLYKTDTKALHLATLGKCVFFDDMDKDLDEARKINDVMVVDRKEFKNYSNRKKTHEGTL